MLSLLMTTEYAPAEDDTSCSDCSSALPVVTVTLWRRCISARARRCTA